jgi:hypothetical protein
LAFTDKPNIKGKPQFHKRLNDHVLRLVELADAKAEVAHLPMSKADKTAICASLMAECEYRIKLVAHIIEHDSEEYGCWNGKRGPSPAKRKNHEKT